MKDFNYRMRITPDDFDLFKKILKIIYNDMGELLSVHKVIDIKVSYGEVKFNEFKLNFDLEENKVVRFLLNLHFLMNKNNQLLIDDSQKRLNEEDWYIEYVKLRDAIKEIQNKKGTKTAFWG